MPPVGAFGVSNTGSVSAEEATDLLAKVVDSAGVFDWISVNSAGFGQVLGEPPSPHFLDLCSAVKSIVGRHLVWSDIPAPVAVSEVRYRLSAAIIRQESTLALNKLLLAKAYNRLIEDDIAVVQQNTDAIGIRAQDQASIAVQAPPLSPLLDPLLTPDSPSVPSMHTFGPITADVRYPYLTSTSSPSISPTLRPSVRSCGSSTPPQAAPHHLDGSHTVYGDANTAHPSLLVPVSPSIPSLASTSNMAYWRLFQRVLPQDASVAHAPPSSPRTLAPTTLPTSPRVPRASSSHNASPTSNSSIYNEDLFAHIHTTLAEASFTVEEKIRIITECNIPFYIADLMVRLWSWE